MKKYNSKTKISELFAKEENFKILKKHNVPCLSCPFAKIEMNILEIGKVAKIYNIDLKQLLADLNGDNKKTKK